MADRLILPLGKIAKTVAFSIVISAFSIQSVLCPSSPEETPEETGLKTSQVFRKDLTGLF